MRIILAAALALVAVTQNAGAITGFVQSDGTVVVRRAHDGRSLIAVVTDMETGKAIEVGLDSAVIRVSTVKTGSNGAVIIGASSHGVLVTITDWKGNVTASFSAATAATSPDGTLVAYQHYNPRGEENPKATYGVYDVVTKSGAPDPQRRPKFFPNDEALHIRQSDLFWVSDRVIAFLDYVDKEVGLVGAEFGPGGRIIRIARKPLDFSLLVREQRTTFLDDPARAISGAKIRRKEGDGMQVRLSFTDPVLAVDQVDVTLW